MFRNAAITVANSIKKGQPVTVHGRFRANEWEGEDEAASDAAGGDGAINSATAEPSEAESSKADPFEAGGDEVEENAEMDESQELALSA